MEKKERKKINSLLRFYFKVGVPISVRAQLINAITVRGKIMKKSWIGLKYIVIQGRDRNPIKIFIEDLECNSIIPIDYEKKENKKINNRSPLPPSLRYKILKRDRFTCKSCGARAPEVELEVDHIIPTSKGGTDDEKNLVATCTECNRGKGNKV